MRNHDILASLSANVGSMINHSIPQLLVDNFSKINDRAYRIEGSFPHGRFKEDKFAEAVSSYYEKQFSLVPSTIRIDSRRNLTGIVVANLLSKPCTTESLKKDGYLNVFANVFSDPDDNMWKVIGEGANKRLVQEATEDYEAILAARLSRRRVHASDTNEVPTFSNGDYVFYYSPLSSEVRAGFGYICQDKGVIKRHIFDRISHRSVPVIASQVLDILEITEPKVAPKRLQTLSDGAFPSSMRTEYLDYMRTLFGNTPYFAELERVYKDRVGMGNATDEDYTLDVKVMPS